MQILSASSFDVIIIGGGAAGVQAAVIAKTSYTSASVAVISDETIIYPRPVLRSIISGTVKSINDITMYQPEDLEGLRIKLLQGYEALSVNNDERLLNVKNHLSGEILPFKYDRLIIATGSVPAIPPIKGSGLFGVFTVKWLNDALALSHYITPGMKAYVIGAGFIGLGVAEALTRRGLKTTVVERLLVLHKLIEHDLSQEIVRRIKSHGINVLEGTTIEEIFGERKVEYVTIEGRKFDADIVVFATGMRPNTLIATQMGLQIAKDGAIKTDAHMKTSLEDVYAIGDCAQTMDIISGKFVYRPIGSIASYAARIAGSNAAGVEQAYNGFLRIQYDRIFENEIVSMGLSTEEAHELGIASGAINVSLKDPKYPPLSLLMPTNALMKAVVQKSTDTIIGWQAVGSRQSSWASLLFREMILNRCNVSDIQELGLKVE